MKILRSLNTLLLSSLIILSLLIGSCFSSFVSKASADSCTPPATTYGTDTLSLPVTDSGSYYIWVRLEAPSTSANEILMNIDNSYCYTVGGSSSIPINSWTWVNYADGATSTPIEVALSSGSHSLVLTGIEAGVAVDRIEALSDNSCTPTGTGDNCASSDTTPPTVSISSGTTGSTSSTSASFSFTGTDNVTPTASLTYQCSLDSAAYTSCTSPASYSGLAPGSHSFSVESIDGAGNISTPATDSWTVTAGGTILPTVPTSLAVSATSPPITATTAQLNWGASTDTGGSGLSGYKVYRNGALIATLSSSTLSYLDTGLTVNTTYSYTVASFDKSGNLSAQTSPLSVKTDAVIGDLDGDGEVTGHDLSILLSHYSTNYPQAEFDGTNEVEGHDLSLLLSNYGK